MSINSFIAKKNNVVFYFPDGSDDKESACNTEDLGLKISSLGREDPLEKEMAIYSSILVWDMDRAAWQATVHGVPKSQT